MDGQRPVNFTTSSLLAFIFLGIIRGTFSVVIHFAVHSYKSPSLVFLLRTPGTVTLYSIFAIFLSQRSNEDKETFLENLRTFKNYWKSAVMGIVQLAAPYMLFMYGLLYLNPTTGGVYMAAAPWASILVEKLPFFNNSHPLPKGKLVAICIGSLGIILVSTSGVGLALQSPSHCTYSNQSNSSAKKEHCIPYSTMELSTALLALMAGCLMWGISSVFWRSKRGNIHYVTAGVGNNLFGGFFALLIWLIMIPLEQKNEISWFNGNAIFSIIFLTLVSGFLAALLVNYMYHHVGASVTNRVLCLVPLVAWLEDWLFVRKFAMFSILYTTLEVVGVVLVFVGLTLSSLESQQFMSAYLQQPLLGSSATTDEESERERFYQNIRVTEEGVSDDEVKRNPESSRTGRNPFPPLVKVKRDDQSYTADS